MEEFEEPEEMEFKRIDHKRKRSDIKKLRGSRFDE